MKERIGPTLFCVCLLVALEPINLSQDKELKWPCKEDLNLLRNKNGKPVWFPAKELRSKIIWYERPEYPKACRCTGSVQVFALINTEGLVECFQFLGGHPLFKATISEALKKWRFQPVTVEARKVSLSTGITFNLNESSGFADNITRPVEAPCKTSLRLFKDASGKPVWMSPEDMENMATFKASPNPDARFEGRTTFFADILVNEKGDVACAKVNNGDQSLRDSVLNAAMKWKFRPMMKNRRRVSFLGSLLFTLRSD